MSRPCDRSQSCSLWYRSCQGRVIGIVRPLIVKPCGTMGFSLSVCLCTFITSVFHIFFGILKSDFGIIVLTNFTYKSRLSLCELGGGRGKDRVHCIRIIYFVVFLNLFLPIYTFGLKTVGFIDLLCLCVFLSFSILNCVITVKKWKIKISYLV